MDLLSVINHVCNYKFEAWGLTIYVRQLVGFSVVTSLFSFFWRRDSRK